MKVSSAISIIALFSSQALGVALPRSGNMQVEQGNRGGNQGANRGGNRGGPFTTSQRPGANGAGNTGKKGHMGGNGKAVTTTAVAATTTAVAATTAAAVTTSLPAAANVAQGGGKKGTSTTSAAGAAGTTATGNGNNNNGNNGGDAQTSLALDPSQVQPNLAADGQATPEAGQVASLTSTNNFINFCLTQKTSITNGLQTKTGSCNPTIMGRILATTNLPSSKFVFPANGGNVEENTTFTIQMAIKNMVTGNFVNPNTNYYAAPCQVDSSGTVIGHSHVVIEKIDSLASTTVTNPNVFAFFKGLNGVAQNGILTADVTGGLAAGTYRLASINTCANHQPVLGSVAQHGSFDDMVYFTVNAAAGGNAGGNAGGKGNAGGNGNVAVSTTAAAATPSGTATGGGKTTGKGATTGGKGGQGNQGNRGGNRQRRRLAKEE